MYMYLVSKETAMHSCIPLEGNRVGPIRRIKADSLIHTKNITHSQKKY